MEKIGKLQEEGLIKEQIELAKRIKMERLMDSARYVAGIDTAYWEEGDVEYCCCVCVLYDMKQGFVVEKASSNGIVNFPYISGFLSYRESAIGIDTIQKLKRHPDIVMVDGNGILHPRKAGEAVKIGVDLDIPTIGVAKKYCKIEDIDFDMPEDRKGAYKDISVHGEILGRAVRTRKGVKPAFVSVGNKITLNEATGIVLQLTTNESYIPIPTRQADLETHILRKELRGF